MASIKDAFQESLQDHNSLIKYIIFAIPVYYCVDLYSKNDILFWAVSAVVFVLLFGIMIKCTTNVRNGKNYVLPTFNIFSIFWSGLKGLIAIGPIIALCTWLAAIICNFLSSYFTEPGSMTVWYFIVWGLFVSFMMTGYLCYSRNLKISDVYNIKILVNASVDVFIGIIFMIPQVLIANAIIAGPITYIIWLFFGIPHPIAVFFLSMCLIFNLSMVGHYLAQIDYETISIHEKEKDNFI